MNKKQFVMIFYFFIVSCFTFGSIYIGTLPVTIRHLATIIMFMTCLSIKPILLKNTGGWQYIGFITLFGFSCLAYGHVSEFIRGVVAYYFVCYVTIWAIYILINRYNTTYPIIISFVILGVVNSFFLILQYLNIPGAFEVMKAFNVEDNYDKYQTLDLSTADVSYPGIFGAVHGGYNTMVALVFSLYFIYKKRSVLSFAVWLFIFAGLFSTQQRAAFFCGVLLSGICFLKMKLLSFRSFSDSFLSIVIILGFFYLLFRYGELLSLIESSRFSNMSEIGVREFIFKSSLEYIQANLFSANIIDYVAKYSVYPHNLFFNAFMYGGLFAALFVFYILIKHTIIAMKVILSKLTAYNIQYSLLGLAFVGYNMISMTHNLSIVTGDTLYWLLICPIIFYTYKSKNIAKLEKCQTYT